jgi:hypothetical protein
MNREDAMKNTMTMDEVKAIEKARDKQDTIGIIVFVGGTVVIGIIIGLTNITWIILFMLVPMLIGAKIVITAPNAHKYERCGEYYTRWQDHTEEVCLRNLKYKLSQIGNTNS